VISSVIVLAFLDQKKKRYIEKCHIENKNFAAEEPVGHF